MSILVAIRQRKRVLLLVQLRDIGLKIRKSLKKRKKPTKKLIDKFIVGAVL